MDGPSAQGFLSLTGPSSPRVVDCRSAAMLIKSALRIHLSVSYGMISILQIGSLRSPPPIRLRHWTHLRCEGSEGSEGSKGSKGSKGKVLRIDRPHGPEGS